jgi:hypothetical protein
MVEAQTARPFTYSIDLARGLIFLVYGEAQPGFAEWRDVMDDLQRDPHFRPGLHLVSDRRRLKEAPTTSTIQQMAQYVAARRATFGDCRWAIVTSAEAPAEYGMVRMASVLFQGAGSGITLRPFTDMQDALAWAADARR